MSSKVTITITLESDSPISVGVDQCNTQSYTTNQPATAPVADKGELNQEGPSVEDVKKALIAAGQRASNAKALKVLKDTTGAAKVSEVKVPDYPKLISKLEEL